MMGLVESRIHVSKEDVPHDIMVWARGRVGSNFSKNITIKQESRVQIGMPWHEADREYWQFFQLGENGSVRVAGDGIRRSGLEGDGVVTGGEVDGYVNIPSGYVLASVGTYPVRLTLYTASDALKPVTDGNELDQFSLNEMVILLQAKGLKSAYRDKFADAEYAKLIEKGYLASNRSITIKGRNLVENPELKERAERYAEEKGMYLNASYKLSKKW
jgi:hypothetical protein